MFSLGKVKSVAKSADVAVKDTVLEIAILKEQNKLLIEEIENIKANMKVVETEKNIVVDNTPNTFEVEVEESNDDATIINSDTVVITDVVEEATEDLTANEILIDDTTDIVNDVTNDEPEIKVESKELELAAKIADYSAQIDLLNEIEDPQVRDLKKQLLIFELQEIKREIALMDNK
jgi:hypothetical protein